ncbi:Ig-like domain-containing protein [Pseudomonas batumici]|uniref:Ig-like domain-containing protein n=1 Tax=Pseudomonas batumici TaxID=226910 RepID=UPI003BAEB097
MAASQTIAAPAIGSSTIESSSRRISLRFSTPMAAASLNNDTVTVIGPTGQIAGAVTPVKDGREVLFVPTQELLPDTHYSVFVSGSTDESGNQLPLTGHSFTTQALAANTASTGANTPPPGALSGHAAPSATPPSAVTSSTGPEDWIPGPEHFTGDWRAKRPPPPCRIYRLCRHPRG